MERRQCSERALKLALAEMYVQGVSTRKVTEITEQLLGLEVSSSEVSRCNKLLDVELEAWQNRPLGEVPYLVLDVRYEKVRYIVNPIFFDTVWSSASAHGGGNAK